MKKATNWNSYHVVKRKNIRVKIREHNRLETREGIWPWSCNKTSIWQKWHCYR